MGKKNIRTTTYHQTLLAAVPDKELRKHLEELGLPVWRHTGNGAAPAVSERRRTKDWHERRQEKQAILRQREDEKAAAPWPATTKGLASRRWKPIDVVWCSTILAVPSAKHRSSAKRKRGSAP